MPDSPEKEFAALLPGVSPLGERRRRRVGLGHRAYQLDDLRGLPALRVEEDRPGFDPALKADDQPSAACSVENLANFLHMASAKTESLPLNFLWLRAPDS